MDRQLTQAVEIALSGTSDQRLQQEAIDFINKIKTSDEGWQHCGNLLTSNFELDQQTKFFIFQVFDEKIHSLNNDQLLILKDFLIMYLTHMLENGTIEPVYLRNKLAKSFGLLFVYSYLTVYPEFLRDLLQTTKDGNHLAVDYYLRILLVIHQEIGDNLIIRERSSVEHNNKLKDQIRANDMLALTLSWKNILQRYSTPKTSTADPRDQLQGEILHNSLSAISGFISWIEIGLIMEQEFLGLIFQTLETSDQQLQIGVLNCLNEIISKKMPPLKKLELLNLLNITNTINNLKFEGLSVDLMEAVTKLINTVGEELIRILDSSSNEELQNQQFKNVTCAKLVELLPLVCELLGHDYDDVSVKIFSFIANYLLFLKKNITNDAVDFQVLSSDEILATLLKKIIEKMKIDEDDDGDDDEAMESFKEVRNKLKNFQESILMLNETLALDIITNVINQSLFSAIEASNITVDWRNIELGLFELNSYNELLRNNVMNLPKTMINNSQPYYVFNEMLCKVINHSPKVLVNHQLIQLSFFELILKNYSFFINTHIQVENQDKNGLLLKVLKIFLSNFGVFNDIGKVKYRTWFVFYRFIKLTNPRVPDPTLEDLINTLLPLLDLQRSLNELNSQPACQGNYDIDLSSLQEDSIEHRLYLFEAVGLLISFIDETNVEFKIKMIELVLQPLFSIVESCINNCSSADSNKLIVVHAHHALMSISSVVKGFETSITYEKNVKVEEEKIISNLQQISEVILITLENFIHYPIIREASRVTIVRLFLILVKKPSLTQDTIDAIFRKFLEVIMNQFDELQTTEVTDFFHFITQVGHYCAGFENIYSILNSLLAPLYNKVLERLKLLEQEGDKDPHLVREKKELKKSLVSFFISISNNHLTSILVTYENKSLLNDLINRLLNYSMDLSDSALCKLAIGELGCLVENIGTGRVTDAQDIGIKANNAFENVDDLLIQNTIVLVFELLFKSPQVDTKDAQFRLIVTEITRLLRKLVVMGVEQPPQTQKDSQGNNITPLKPNEAVLQNLQAFMANNMQFPINVVTDLLQKLISQQERHFSKYLLQLVIDYRGT
ncbi:hypothetical protein LJB42_004550 [Komagataella kurtzmanii]|nr:hypothetical protein LJB42_004550 [Komagataella kurtzmanii]